MASSAEIWWLWRLPLPALPDWSSRVSAQLRSVSWADWRAVIASLVFLAALAVALPPCSIATHLPDRAAGWSAIWPGAIGFAVLWLGATAAFGFYAANFGSYNATYGALGAVLALITWFWVSGYALLLGAELVEVRQGRAELPADRRKTRNIRYGVLYNATTAPACSRSGVSIERAGHQQRHNRYPTAIPQAGRGQGFRRRCNPLRPVRTKG